MIRRRFTLIEILIAVAIFTLVMLTLYGFGRQVTRGWERIRRDQHRLSDLMTLDRALDTMLGNAVPFLWPDPDAGDPPPDRLVFAGHQDWLLLTTLQRAAVEDSDGAIRFVLLSVEDGQLLARYHSRPFRHWRDVGEAGRVAVLATGVDRVEFQYADFTPGDNAEWDSRLEWTSEWDTNPDLPREEIPLAIMITVVWQDGRVESWLRRTAGQGYRERYGKWSPRKE